MRDKGFPRTDVEDVDPVELGTAVLRRRLGVAAGLLVLAALFGGIEVWPDVWARWTKPVAAIALFLFGCGYLFDTVLWGVNAMVISWPWFDRAVIVPLYSWVLGWKRGLSDSEAADFRLLRDGAVARLEACDRRRRSEDEGVNGR